MHVTSSVFSPDSDLPTPGNREPLTPVTRQGRQTLRQQITQDPEGSPRSAAYAEPLTPASRSGRDELRKKMHVSVISSDSDSGPTTPVSGDDPLTPASRQGRNALRKQLCVNATGLDTESVDPPTPISAEDRALLVHMRAQNDSSAPVVGLSVDELPDLSDFSALDEPGVLEEQGTPTQELDDQSCNPPTPMSRAARAQIVLGNVQTDALPPTPVSREARAQLLSER
eukprot:TRINITY_DN15779_c0_g1_i3.p1 TRINITY_DN15779_c0_g1~~TRINITY_DN15779_c0_g1_i3.p1  ORF type:complete len:227 (+),score=41.04 TRINITY_DN15779_c0_g1_i3:185-865(+)